MPAIMFLNALRASLVFRKHGKPANDRRGPFMETNIKAIVDARNRFQATAMSIPGVLGISVGLRQVKGALTSEFGIVFYVNEKNPPQDIPENTRIPRDICVGAIAGK
jgi:hypothetical protein